MSNNSLLPNNPRLYLWVALALLLILNVQYWMKDYAPPPQAPETGAANASGTATAAAPANDLGNRIPQGAGAGDATTSAPPAAAASASVQAGAPAVVADAAAASAPVVHVHTDVLDVDISPAAARSPAWICRPILWSRVRPRRCAWRTRTRPRVLYELQSGLTGAAGGRVPHAPRRLHERAQRLPLRQRSGAERAADLERGHGVTVTKTFIFQRGQYAIGLDYEVHNGGSAPVERCAPMRRSCATIRAPRAPISTWRATPSTDLRFRTAPSTASSIRPAAMTASCRSRCAMAGWRRCSIISSVPSCRPRGCRGISRSASRARSTCSPAQVPR